MCSIPGLPTPGSEVPVLITRVNLNPACGLVELWVNLDDGRKHIYEQMREEIQIPKRSFYGSEGKPGDLCLVCISDTWHRARIVSIKSETYSVFLIDQGQPHTATSEALAWGQSDSFLLPPEIESCILANVLSFDNNWPERATKFLMSLPGKKFKGLVQHVLMSDRIILLDIPMASRHMCKLGVVKKIPVDEFKRLVVECVCLPKGEASEFMTHEQNLHVIPQVDDQEQYFYPELSTNTFESVTVTEVTDPLNIFCQLLIFSKAVKLLSEQIQQRYEASSDFGDAQPQTSGSPCAAKGANGRWHRSLLKQDVGSGEGEVEVFHVDEGKTESVPVGNIKPLLGRFLRMPVVTYFCSLSGIKENGREWTEEEANYLKSWLLNQPLVAKFDHYSVTQDVYFVTLHGANATCVNSSFIEKMGLIPPLEQVVNVQNEPLPSFLYSLGDEQCIDSQNKAEDLPDDIWTSTGLGNVNGRTDDVTPPRTNEIHIKASATCTDVKRNLLTSFFSEVQSSCNDDTLTAGSVVDVKVSCVESLQKFWCQATDSSDSLRDLMQDLQTHYASAHCRPLFETVCVARNPDDDMWYRARIISRQHSPIVDVRFIDYGHIQKVPLQDVLPIDASFLQLTAQAFQCSLFNLNNPTDAALTEFQKLVDLGPSLNAGLKCVVKAVTSDEEGRLLNVVDIETESDSACRLLAEKCAQPQAREQIPPQVPSDTYNYSTYDIEVGGKEKVWVTASESVDHFYCQLHRNSHLFVKLTENVAQLLGQPQSSDHPLGLNSICFARYTDNGWYRGEVVEMFPKTKVHFVDFGDTLEVNKTDIRPIPSEASAVRSVSVLAVPLGLFNVPVEVPQEVNQWFADHAIGQNFTISVMKKGEKGKLIVELFEGSLNVNDKVRERMAKMGQHKMTGVPQQTDRQLPKSSKEPTVPNEDSLTQVLRNPSEKREQNSVHSENGVCAKDELEMNSESTTNVPSSETEHILDEGRENTLNVVLEDGKSVAETFIQGYSDSEMTQPFVPSCLEGNVNICMYLRPNVSQNKIVEAYASCIVGPHFFWCQYTNTEVLNAVSNLAQEAGWALDEVIPETLAPGSPCLALYSSDKQWYRAQVIRKSDRNVHVLFVDYGNESDVGIENVRAMPQSVLEFAPQAFLCSLNGFDEAKGSWHDDVYDDFYNLLVDKQLIVTAFDMQNNLEIAVPQYMVTIECDKVVINDLMQKYWTSESDMAQTGTLPQDIQTEATVTKGNGDTPVYREPEILKNKTETAYASCIVEPNFFWCQFSNTEDLSTVSQLAQEAGRAQQDATFPEPLGPGSPCLALFTSDNQWYRAQVIRRADDALCVVFIDYGNESNVEIENVRPLPQSLQEKAPLAFLCRLNGFDESKGSWDDEVYDVFYNLLVDKPLKVTVFSLEGHSEITVPQYSVEIECEGEIVNGAMQKYWKPVTEESVITEDPQTETILQDDQTESDMTHTCVFKDNVSTYVYKEPAISQNKTETVYASCIVEPHFFWCQFSNTEDLSTVSRLAQEAGQAEEDVTFLESLGPGSPCLVLFYSDNQWYRAQVIRRVDDTVCVVFIDYGNESEADIKNVRSLPQGLQEMAPLAFLCCLNGFDESKGSWDDEVYDVFYNLLVDKPLEVTVLSSGDHSELAVPRYAVEVECEGAVVNSLMEKYWKGVDTDGDLAESFESVDLNETGTVNESVEIENHEIAANEWSEPREMTQL